MKREDLRLKEIEQILNNSNIEYEIFFGKVWYWQGYYIVIDGFKIEIGDISRNNGSIGYIDVLNEKSRKYFNDWLSAFQLIIDISKKYGISEAYNYVMDNRNYIDDICHNWYVRGEK